jgi:hypothetical protein
VKNVLELDWVKQREVKMDLLNLNKYKIPGIDKIIKVSDEIVTRKNGEKYYTIKYFLFNNKFLKHPIIIRFLSKSKSFINLSSIEFFNKKLEPAIGIDLKENIPDDKMKEFLSKLPEGLKFKETVKENKIVENYLESIQEGLGSKIIKIFDERPDLVVLAINGILLFTTLLLLLRYYIIKIRNAHEEYQSQQAEQSINKKLFQGQKYDESAFDMYSNLQNFIKYVALGKAPAVILCGPPGTSKTYIVRRVFYFEKLKPGSDYTIEKGGGLSVAAIYDLLFKNRNRILILDDFDTPLQNEDTINMLKAITDSYERRILSISREKLMSSGQQSGSETPTKFEYRGKLIIITNILKKDINRALLSRAPAFEVHFSSKEIMEALEKLLQFMSPQVSMEIKREVLDYIIYLKSKKSSIQVDFRSFKNAVDARVGNPTYWKEMVQTIVEYN